MQQLRAAKQWINQAGWNAASEANVVSKKTQKNISLRLGWSDVKKRLADSTAAKDKADFVDVKSNKGKYDLNTLDPTQRAFADRVFRWADYVVIIYKSVLTGTNEQIRYCVHGLVARLEVGSQRRKK